MKIISLDIQNFRGIQSARFAFHDKLNVFIGENGAGKSTVLNCLAILLSRLTWRIISQSSSGRFFTEEDVYRGENKTKNTIEALIFDKKYMWTAGKSIERNKKQTLSNQEDIKSIVANVNERLEADEHANIPLIAFYSTNRSVISVPLKVKKQHKFDQIASLENSLLGKREESDFKLFFEWFRNREDEENEAFRRRYKELKNRQYYDEDYLDPQLKAVRVAIHTLMPDFDSLQVKRKPSLRMVIKKGKNEFQIQELSDGEKCLLALVADMARRIAMANPSVPNPLEAEAVFLIDEIELHLHPAWQRMIVPKLLEVFPNCQFFITTHSPQVLGEVQDTKSIWLLKPGEPPDHPDRAYGLNSNEVLGEIMGAQERSLRVQEQLQKIDSFINNEKFNEARQTIQALAKQTKIIPALLEANSMLTMLGEEQADLDNLGDHSA